MHFQKYWISGDEEYILLATNVRKVFLKFPWQNLTVELATLVFRELLHLSYLIERNHPAYRRRSRRNGGLRNLVTLAS